MAERLLPSWLQPCSSCGCSFPGLYRPFTHNSLKSEDLYNWIHSSRRTGGKKLVRDRKKRGIRKERKKERKSCISQRHGRLSLTITLQKSAAVYDERGEKRLGGWKALWKKTAKDIFIGLIPDKVGRLILLLYNIWMQCGNISCSWSFCLHTMDGCSPVDSSLCCFFWPVLFIFHFCRLLQSFTSLLFFCCCSLYICQWWWRWSLTTHSFTPRQTAANLHVPCFVNRTVAVLFYCWLLTRISKILFVCVLLPVCVCVYPRRTIMTGSYHRYNTCHL